MDGCPLVWGSLNGCPVLTIEISLLEAPDSETRTANISITITCESGCYMDWTLEGNSLVSEGANVLNGTYYTSYTNVVDESKTLSARVSVDGSWFKDTMMTVYFPPIVDDIESPIDNETGPVDTNTDGPSQSDSAGEQDTGFQMDAGSIAMIAMLLLLNVGVVAAIMASRSRSKKKRGGREMAMAAFERDLFSNAGPVAPLPSMPATPAPAPAPQEPQPTPVEYVPPQQPQAPEQPTTPTIPDLPSIEDLLG